jgi:uncharacterized membrane protein YqhA
MIMTDNNDNKLQSNQGKDDFENWLDRHVEKPFFALRYVTLVPVILSFFGVILMFGIGAIETYEAFHSLAGFFEEGADHDAQIKKSSLMLIRSVDAFLMGLVLLIFSYGIYDLFVSNLEPAHKQFTRPNWLLFNNIGDLKITLTEVVFIILVIIFFEQVLENGAMFTENVWSFLIIPVGVILLAVGIAYFHSTAEKH